MSFNNTRARSDLLGPSAMEEGRPKGRAWGAPQETEATKDLTDHDLLSQQRTVMNEQDKVLDILGHTVGNIKEIAYQIGTETDEHTGLLDDIDHKVDKTTSKMKNTTRQIDRVNVKSSTKGMWVCICLLILGLVGITAAAFYT